MKPIFKVAPITGVCSAITLYDINVYELSRLNKNQIFNLIKKYSHYDCNNDLNLIGIKTIQITLNCNRFWSLFTPWKFAYSYKGNSGNCSVFYLNL